VQLAFKLPRQGLKAGIWRRGEAEPSADLITLLLALKGELRDSQIPALPSPLDLQAPSRELEALRQAPEAGPEEQALR